MIKKLTAASYDYLVKKGAIDKNNMIESEWIKYGIEVSISSLIGLIIIVLISIIMKSTIHGLIFLTVFVTTRQYTGGYHANTYLKCNLTFSIGYFIIVILSKYLFFRLPLYILYVSFAIEMIIIILMSPIENRHKPINCRGKYIKYKIIGSALYLSFGIAGLQLLRHAPQFGYTIHYTLNLIFLLGIIGYFKERSYLHEKSSKCNR